ncbi:FAD/NAD(P)-binding domain-containing protein [Daldinia decipiens]|uniref:FAD/NAD(P)-binding domain-containing protein n=1 Tax=Daldinia decipiens TaxID=326647 RepID=UPI0020C537E2|nr:FAD/NAD(P)-binding domain-containing protein [Daldinia decipiens]KAI1652705.1 FAD/NAD(P)-binding domain-containing protein [Daldinia decipiens]
MNHFLSTSTNDVARLCEADFYDYIIVGSGMGGGVLARTLLSIKDKDCPRVLLIERGKPFFSTHVLNTPTPRWNPDIPDGPSSDNSFVYDAVKSPVSTVTSRSNPYAGGPVHCLGGRSNVWGLYTPWINKEEAEGYFPKSICDYLFGGPTPQPREECIQCREEKKNGGMTGYDRAYKLLTGDPRACLSHPYPRGTFNYRSSSDSTVDEDIDKVVGALGTGTEFTLCPMAAHFTHRNPREKLYQMSRGGFSTVSWILEQIYNKSEHLHVLPETQVVAVNGSRRDSMSTDNNEKSVRSLIIRDNFNNERAIRTGKATVILCAGTIDTAIIALRSGLGNKLVGSGLTDHDIWGTRFEYLDESANLQALRLQSHILLKSDPTSTPPSNPETTRCLLNITINAQSFLGWGGEMGFPTQFLSDGKEVNEYTFRDAERSAKSTNKKKSILQVVFILGAKLEEKNRVLNLPEDIPTIEITSRVNNSKFVQDMKRRAKAIKDALEAGKLLSVDEDKNEDKLSKQTLPEVSRADFGVVAHEVGTMRMSKDKKPEDEKPENGVVDENLKVHDWKNLYVCDLSVFPASPAANPSLTLVALAQRLGDHLKGLSKKNGNVSQAGIERK